MAHGAAGAGGGAVARRFGVRAAMVVVALSALPNALAQAPIDCARLPAAERDAARRAGRCVDSPAAAAPARIDPTMRAAQIGLPVPRLIDAPLNRNDERIARFKLETTYQPGVQPRDWVLDQQPPAGSRLRAGGSLTLTLSDGTRVLVPRVVALDADAARERLRRAGLTAEVEPAAGAPANRVIAQQPAAGTEVSRRSAVTLRVTDGTQPPTPPDGKGASAELRVPNVVGLSYDDAIARLARFRPERSHRAGVEPGGEVIAQDPPAGTTRPSGSAVAIVLSDGTLTVVPDLLGYAFDRAIQRLQQSALRWQRIDSTSEQAVGQVIGQAPVAGDRIARGSVVRVQVSSGPAPLELPDVVGMRVDDAIARLAPFAVSRAETAANAPRGEVVAQRPAAGTRLVRGSAVELSVSSGQEAIEVPDVVDDDVASARARLGEFRVTTIAVPGRPPRERVVAQAPPAGTMQPAGAAVTLSVSDGSLADPPRTDSAPPAVTGAPPSLGWWLLAGGFGALMLGAGVVVGRLGAPKPLPRVHADATLVLAPAEARVDGAAVIEPALQLQATLEPGAASVEPSSPEAS